MIQEASLDENETLDHHNPGTSQADHSLQRGENIRSGIRDLLDANKEVPVVDADTAIALETLLSQMDQRNKRWVLFLPSAWMSDSIPDC